jgi:hypothetical protein
MRWTEAQLQQFLAKRDLQDLPAKKISKERSESDSNERRKFREHKPNEKYNFCESFLK